MVLATDPAPPPLSADARGIEIAVGARQITVAGQVGVPPGGVLVADARGAGIGRGPHLTCVPRGCRG